MQRSSSCESFLKRIALESGLLVNGKEGKDIISFGEADDNEKRMVLFGSLMRDRGVVFLNVRRTKQTDIENAMIILLGVITLIQDDRGG